MKRPLFLLALVLTIFTSCKEDDPVEPEIPNEEEVITTLIYTLTPQGGGDAVVFSFQDLDGDGGNDPVYSQGTLAANTTYDGAIILQNELEDPVENITEEVEEEAEEHQFFYQEVSNGIVITYGDADSNGNPIGILTTLETGDAEMASLTIILKHEPDKEGESVSEGDITNAGGETDISVTFDVNIE